MNNFFNYTHGESISYGTGFYKKSDISDNIRNYGDTIETLDTFVEAVRKLPGMYIGAIGNSGWKSCIREIFQNAVDEMVKEESPCHYIKILFDERDQSCLIEDTGRGIPHGKIIHIFTSAHSSSNYTKKPGQYSSGVHGVGSGVALSLSKHFDIKSYVLGQAKEVQFTDGIPWNDGEKDIPCPEGRQGSSIYMSPALDVLGEVNLTSAEIFDLVYRTLMLTNIGDRIDFEAIDLTGNVCISEQLENKDGIITDLIVRTQTPLVNPIHYSMDTGYMKAEIAFTYDSSNITSSEEITSYSNFTPTLGGKHVDGFLKGVCSFFVKYMNKFYLSNTKSKLTVINNDVKTAMKAVIVAAHLNPIFIGQSKAILSNEDMEKFVYDLTVDYLNQWSSSNTTDLNKICKFIKDIAEIRAKSDDNKINLSKRITTSSLSKMPKKYVKPSVYNKELFIVEGDSAKGGIVNERETTTQGVFPIRGKLPNAFEKSKSDFLNNEEVASIITIIGGGYGNNFDLSKVKWEKIIICTDADNDGYHIRTLLLRFFLLYMPDLIKDGRVYAAVPPLYGAKSGKKNMYFISKLDYTRYVQSLFMKKHTIARSNRTQLSTHDITALFNRNIDYVDEINIIRDTFAINPYLLEAILYEYNKYIQIDEHLERVNAPIDIISEYNNYQSGFNNDNGLKKGESFLDLITDNPLNRKFNYTISPDFDFKKFKKVIEKKFRFIKVSKDDYGNISINGLVDSQSQTIILKDKIIMACEKIIKIMNTNEDIFYIVDGNLVTLYDLMNLFKKSSPNIERYKGLGEQDPKELAESVIRPDGLRTLIRYNIEDIKYEIGLIRYIDSNKGMLLKNFNISKHELE